MEPVSLTPEEKELLTRVAQFARRRAQNGVYLNQAYSKSLGAPVLLLVAMGEQALTLEKIIMSAAVPDEVSLIERPVVKNFNDNGD